MSSYSTHEAKAKFSEIIRKVRNGQRVEITYHGEIVAEIRPASASQTTLADRIAQLEKDGIVGGSSSKAGFSPLRHRPGALARFLEDRD